MKHTLHQEKFFIWQHWPSNCTFLIENSTSAIFKLWQAIFHSKQVRELIRTINATCSYEEKHDEERKEELLNIKGYCCQLLNFISIKLSNE